MGCDIHLVLERRHNDKWVAVNTFKGHHVSAMHRKEGQFDWSYPIATSRNYARFAALAGVRGDGPAPRGVPEDASETTKYLVDYWGSDGHSHSWMSLVDAMSVFVATEPWHDSEGDDYYGRKYPASFFFEVEDDKLDCYRIVFWFDN